MHPPGKCEFFCDSVAAEDITAFQYGDAETRLSEVRGANECVVTPVTLFVCPNGVNWEGVGLSGPA